MQKLFWFATLSFCVALVHANYQKTTVDEYLNVLTTQIVGQGFSCPCLSKNVTSGRCNNICDQTSCKNVINSIKQCTVGCDDACAALQAFDAETICSSAPYIANFFDGGGFCNYFRADLNYLVDAYELEVTIRTNCEALNDYIAAGSCNNACRATTCTGYFGELQICAKLMRDRDCYVALNAMREYVSTGLLNCQHFDRVQGGCRMQHTDAALADITIQTFSDLFPEGFGLVFGNETLLQCSCLASNIKNCGFCNATDSCAGLLKLKQCALDTDACDDTGCSDALDSLYELTQGKQCFDVGDGFTNCTHSGNEIQLLGCTGEKIDACKDREDAVKENTTVPIFYPLPTPSVTRSRHASVTPSPSREDSPASAFSLHFLLVALTVLLGLW